MREVIEKAKRHLQKIRRLAAKRKSPLSGMTKEEVINKIRRDREKIWEERLALRP